MSGRKIRVEKSVLSHNTTTTALPASERFLATSYRPNKRAERNAAPTHIY
jgi:hypothetical protein